MNVRNEYSLCENADTGIINLSSWGVNMSRFIEGEDRHQVTLFPESIDDYIAEDNPVRVIDIIVLWTS